VIWLGDKRGSLSDWVTQQWVKATGRCIDLSKHSWLDGPAGDTRLIGMEFFTNYAEKNGFKIDKSLGLGLIDNFESLSRNGADLSIVAPSVRRFYERTSEYELDAWSEWSKFFKPFGQALAVIFSRRLQQLNIPLSSLDSREGMTSTVLRIHDLVSGQVQTAWIRKLRATGYVLYAGSYSVCHVPGYSAPCVKVTFPLPNGRAIVLMRPEGHSDGSFSVTSSGKSFGDPGFYFVVQDRDGTAWARYVKSMKESIHVYPAETGTTRADHNLWIWGMQFLRLHYRMRLKTPATTSVPANIG
jgi:hypothetical protein